MNRHLFTLATKARLYAWEREQHWSAGPEREDLFEEKFAELIVKECAAIAGDNYGTHDGVYHDNLGEAIKQHFGVE